MFGSAIPVEFAVLRWPAEYKSRVRRSGRATRTRNRRISGGAPYLSRDASQDAVKELEERIDQFAAQAPTTGPDAEAARALLAHSRLLQELIPSVDETLKALVAALSRQPLEELRAQFSDRRSAVEVTAQRFRLLPPRRAAEYRAASRGASGGPHADNIGAGGAAASRSRGPITKNQVAALLKDFEIRPVVVLRPSERISRGTVTRRRNSRTRSRFLRPEPNIRTLKRGGGEKT